MTLRSPDIPLFDTITPTFQTARERYGIWPTTVWEADVKDPLTRELKRLIGDRGEAREGVFTKDADDASTYRGKLSASIFSPAVAAWAMNLYLTRPCLVADPFAGGGTRAIMAAALGHKYIGTELRTEEADAVNERIATLGYGDRARVVVDDARNLAQHVQRADMVLTCPPYWNLEKYNGGPSDLSMAPTYSLFLDGIEAVARSCRAALKPGAVAFWVAGLHRQPNGALLPLHHGIAEAHRRVGFEPREEIVIHRTNDGSMTRIGQFEKGNRHLVRQHEYGLVFRR